VSPLWQRSILLLAVLALAALGTGFWFGAIVGLQMLAAGLALAVFHHLRHLARLERWLSRPDDSLPGGSGVWDDVFYRLRRILKQRSQSEERLSSAFDRLLQVTEAMPDGVVVLDETDRIALCNPVAELHFGIDSKRDLGQQITFLVRDPRFVDHLASGGRGEPLSLRLPGALQRVLTVQLVPYGDRQKLLISRDVTRVERLETTRRDFIANVSHELRTPLTVLAGFLETLAGADKPDPAMLKRALMLMTDQTHRMARLVEDLLTLSRLEDEHNLLREENVNIPAMARDLYHEALSLSGGRHRITLRMESQSWLRGSLDELRSAAGNLISNAIRYTPEGGHIQLAWEELDGQVVFSVTDSGIGIPAEHIPRLTERFYRVDHSRSRETGGTGLGLAIVKHVLNRHDGRLEIASQTGKGSRFSAWFPANRRVAAPEAAVEGT
jgi:two-component system, OmpR family, phosphate regulon sensor histidine kinase PhoR